MSSPNHVKSGVLYSVSLAVGGGLGIVIASLVNLALIEITISPFFSLYFGGVFSLVGCIILWRVRSHNATDPSQEKRLHLSVFACLIISSGLLCFLLDRGVFHSMRPWMKVPLYMLLGLSVSFALTFSLVDILNYAVGFCRSGLSKPVVESAQQVHLVLAVSMAMGVAFGFTFGLLDVEDEQRYHIRVALMREEHCCYPLGVVLGALAGLGSEHLRQRDDYASFQHYAKTEFDEDI